MNFVVQTAKNSKPLEVFGDMILLSDIVYMKTYFGHLFMIHKMEKNNFFSEKNAKKKFFEKN